MQRKQNVQSKCPPYDVLAGDPGIFCEIYLPKKTAYQGILYESLTAGFNTGVVVTHLNENKEGVREFFKKYDFDRLDQYFPVGDTFNPMYFGYSMYEVDGVFRGSDHQIWVDEERTQVIRIIFRFHSDEVARQFSLPLHVVQQIGRIFFRNQSSHTAFVKQHYSIQHKGGAALSPEENKFLEFLSSWHDRVTLFVFGFLVFRFCRKIAELHGEDVIDHPEQEIWVTQFWNININRVCYAGDLTTPSIS